MTTISLDQGERYQGIFANGSAPNFSQRRRLAHAGAPPPFLQGMQTPPVLAAVSARISTPHCVQCTLGSLMGSRAEPLPDGIHSTPRMARVNTKRPATCGLNGKTAEPQKTEGQAFSHWSLTSQISKGPPGARHRGEYRWNRRDEARRAKDVGHAAGAPSRRRPQHAGSSLMSRPGPHAQGPPLPDPLLPRRRGR